MISIRCSDKSVMVLLALSVLVADALYIGLYELSVNFAVYDSYRGEAAGSYAAACVDAEHSVVSNVSSLNAELLLELLEDLA
jgi:hypothetical protein